MTWVFLCIGFWIGWFAGRYRTTRLYENWATMCIERLKAELQKEGGVLLDDVEGKGDILVPPLAYMLRAL